jgi:GMP synthase (glutamine-hydrolysing)
MSHPALIVTHHDEGRTGLVAECFAAAGCPTVQWDPPEPGPPPFDEISGIVSLGGLASATRADSDPELAAEVKLMREALAAGVPILGMCLGAQLLAVAAGGRVAPMGRKYLGWTELTMLADAREDPVFGSLRSGLPVLKWHEDMIEMPPSAELLGETPTTSGTALFRVGGTAWGSQPHLEVDVPMLIDGWLANQTDVGDVIAAGYDLEGFRAESRHRLECQIAAARPVFTAFAELVAGRPGVAARPPVGDQRLWQTASTLLPSGSSTNPA